MKRFLKNPQSRVGKSYARTPAKKTNRLLFAVALLFLSYKSLAQPLISLTVKEEKLETVMMSIKKQTGYGLIYNSDLLAQTHPLTFTFVNAPLKQVLDRCFENQPVSYQIIEQVIVVTTKDKQPKQPKTHSNDTIIIRGIVVNAATGKPLAGVSVVETGTTNGAVTGDNGIFTLIASKTSSVLKFSSVGFIPIEINTKGSKAISVNLSPEEIKLDEVQVIAYGTTTRRRSTGSVSSVTAADLKNQPVSNPFSAIQGRIPGLEISQQSGVPGSSFKVQLRGQSSLDLGYSRNDPLIIIDGVPFEQGNMPTNQIATAANNPTSISEGGVSPLNTTNPADIERIDVLKDADATAIYGSRGANGVIIITTKRNNKNATEAGVIAHSGISRIGRYMNMLNISQYLQMRREAFQNDALSPTTSNAPDLLLWDTTRYTDFKDVLIGHTAKVNTLNAYVSGGTGNTRFRLSTGYRKETSAYSELFSNRVSTVALNLNHQSADSKFKLSISAIYGIDKNTLPKTDITQYINLPPNLKLLNDDGTLSWSDKGVDYNLLGFKNPLAFLNEKAVTNNENLSSNINFSYSLPAGLLVRISAGYNRFSSDDISSTPFAALDPTLNLLPSASFAKNENKSWIMEPQLEYNINKSGQRLSILLGATYQEREQKGYAFSGTNYRSDLLLGSIAAAGVIRGSNSYSQYRYNAAFGRITYNKNDELIVNLTGRRDGSSRFGPSNRWANFGAIGGAWVFTKTVFKKGETLNFGKLRASYGLTGNDQIGDYKYLNLWQSSPTTYDNIDGLYPVSLYNPDYSWEINRKLEIGLDLGLFRDRLLLNANFYRNRCSNQLINYLLPGQSGFSNVIRNFPGVVQNSGIEAALSTSDIRMGRFTWSIAGNISVPKNKLVRFPALESSAYRGLYLVGKSLSAIQAYQYNGLDQATGLYTFEDVNQDGVVYDLPDYRYVGNLDPKFYGGLQNTFSYRGLAFGFFLHYVKQDGKNYLARLSSAFPGKMINQPDLVLNRWQNTRTHAELQKYSTLSGGLVAQQYARLSLSNAAYSDASFIRLKNVFLSYSVPKETLKRWHIRQLRFFAEAQNLLTITGFKGSDPETQDLFRLPPLKTITTGIQVDL